MSQEEKYCAWDIFFANEPQNPYICLPGEADFLLMDPIVFATPSSPSNPSAESKICEKTIRLLMKAREYRKYMRNLINLINAHEEKKSESSLNPEKKSESSLNPEKTIENWDFCETETKKWKAHLDLMNEHLVDMEEHLEALENKWKTGGVEKQLTEMRKKWMKMNPGKELGEFTIPFKFAKCLFEHRVQEYRIDWDVLNSVASKRTVDSTLLARVCPYYRELCNKDPNSQKSNNNEPGNCDQCVDGLILDVYWEGITQLLKSEASKPQSEASKPQSEDTSTTKSEDTSTTKRKGSSKPKSEDAPEFKEKRSFDDVLDDLEERFADWLDLNVSTAKEWLDSALMGLQIMNKCQSLVSCWQRIPGVGNQHLATLLYIQQSCRRSLECSQYEILRSLSFELAQWAQKILQPDGQENADEPISWEPSILSVIQRYFAKLIETATGENKVTGKENSSKLVSFLTGSQMEAIFIAYFCSAKPDVKMLDNWKDIPKFQKTADKYPNLWWLTIRELVKWTRRLGQAPALDQNSLEKIFEAITSRPSAVYIDWLSIFSACELPSTSHYLTHEDRQNMKTKQGQPLRDAMEKLLGWIATRLFDEDFSGSSLLQVHSYRLFGYTYEVRHILSLYLDRHFADEINKCVQKLWEVGNSAKSVSYHSIRKEKMKLLEKSRKLFMKGAMLTDLDKVWTYYLRKQRINTKEDIFQWIPDVKNYIFDLQSFSFKLGFGIDTESLFCLFKMLENQDIDHLFYQVTATLESMAPFSLTAPNEKDPNAEKNVEATSRGNDQILEQQKGSNISAENPQLKALLNDPGKRQELLGFANSLVDEIVDQLPGGGCTETKGFFEAMVECLTAHLKDDDKRRRLIQLACNGVNEGPECSEKLFSSVDAQQNKPLEGKWCDFVETVPGLMGNFLNTLVYCISEPWSDRDIRDKLKDFIKMFCVLSHLAAGTEVNFR